MGRNKIQIKLIKNKRLRNITYNKRKKGLLKKIVQMSKLCGIPLKLQFKDIYGNLVTLNSINQKNSKNIWSSKHSRKIYRFSQADYPDFKGLDKIRKRRNEDEGDCSQDIEYQEENNLLSSQSQTQKEDKTENIQTSQKYERLQEENEKQSQNSDQKTIKSQIVDKRLEVNEVEFTQNRKMFENYYNSGYVNQQFDYIGYYQYIQYLQYIGMNMGNGNEQKREQSFRNKLQGSKHQY